ncbi:hypothetical protein STRMOE7_04050 [Streptomyces sp. MOE7]|nr:hypothetical protein STRMOE7_04050 [Streptomyces sp. MOE7]
MHATPHEDHRLAHRCTEREFTDRLPVHPTMPELLAHRADHDGSAPYLTFHGADHTALTLTYRDTLRLSRRLAAWATRELDARPGDVFALAPVNELRSVTAVFGLLLAGCAILSLNPADPAGRITEQAEALGAKALLRAPDAAADATVPWVPLPDPRELPAADDDWTGPDLDPGRTPSTSARRGRRPPPNWSRSRTTTARSTPRRCAGTTVSDRATASSAACRSTTSTACTSPCSAPSPPGRTASCSPDSTPSATRAC